MERWLKRTLLKFGGDRAEWLALRRVDYCTEALKKGTLRFPFFDARNAYALEALVKQEGHKGVGSGSSAEAPVAGDELALNAVAPELNPTVRFVVGNKIELIEGETDRAANIVAYE